MSDDWELHLGDNLEALRKMADGSVDAVVSDPPYGLSDHSPEDIAIALAAWLKGETYEHGKGGFMGKGWDSFVPGPILWKECFRVLKPGGHLLAFAGTRTLDLMGMSLRLAGFEIRDGIAWLHGQGFPKSHDVSKALDKVAGTEFSERPAEGVGFMRPDGRGGYNVTRNRLDRVGESSPEAQEWAGWGTALKPAFEPVVVARRPMMGTVAANVLAHGTGALNIDGCRLSWGADAPTQEEWNQKGAKGGSEHYGQISPASRLAYAAGKIPVPTGRWPSNVILGHAEECERVGTKRVKGRNAVLANTTEGEPLGRVFEGGFTRSPSGVYGYADAEGYETVESWNCVPDCPVSMLDEQSGELRPRGNVNSSVGGGGSFGLPIQGNNHHQREDLKEGGGASRFFFTCQVTKAEQREIPCTEESKEVASTSGGQRMVLIEKSLLTDGYGNRPTETSPQDGKSITRTMTPSTTHSTISSVSRPSGTTTITNESERIMCGETGSNIGAVNDVESTGPLMGSRIDPEVGNRDTVSLAVDKLSANGGSETASTTTPTCGSTDGIVGSRFFYTAKASKNERTANGRVPNNHPTVKPLALMRYLCRLVTPPGGVVLDPFMGSGTTGVAARQEGFRFVGMERDEDSYETAKGRIALAHEPHLWNDPVKETPPPVKTTLSDLLGFGDD